MKFKNTLISCMKRHSPNCVICFHNKTFQKRSLSRKLLIDSIVASSSSYNAINLLRNGSDLAANISSILFFLQTWCIDKYSKGHDSALLIKFFKVVKFNLPFEWAIICSFDTTFKLIFDGVVLTHSEVEFNPRPL